MVDRESRDKLAGLIHACINEHVTWHEAERLLGKSLTQSDDFAVAHAADVFWGYAETDELPNDSFDKSQWDHLQRLLLLLASDMELAQPVKQRSWERRQCIAAVCLVVLILSLPVIGLNLAMLLVTVPISAVTMLLWRAHADDMKAAREATQGYKPFPDFATLRAARRAAPHFRKQPCPENVRLVDNSETLADRVVWGIMRFADMLVFVPLILVVELFVLLTPRQLEPPRVVSAADEASLRI